MPDDLNIIAPHHPPPGRADIPAAVATTLAGIGRPKRLTVLVNDPQRHSDSRSVLRALAAQCPATNQCRILVAAGTHRYTPAQRQDFRRRLLEDLPFETLDWHDCRSPALLDITGGWKGHPWLVDADAVLAIGSVEPHYFAGFTGAHKTCTVGCASFGDIERNHAQALDPRARTAALEGNPVYDGIAAMARGLQQQRPVSAVNLVQSAAGVHACVAGDALTALKQAAPIASEVFCRTIGRPADALVLEVAGPLADTFYQADKAIKNNEWAVRDGGCLVLAAACDGGIGQDHFVSLLNEASTYRQAVEVVQTRGYRLGDHKAVKLRYLSDRACRGVRLFAVSPGLSPADADILGMTKADTITVALTAAGVQPGRDAVYRVLDAGNVAVTVADP